ncbi:hypothetical protein BpHYR1_003292 [Brachionus plicatilis]|uniref:Uncharacterized protein n=1 Tax=Brachionus plicatilis TaxID=10195 RepID=A0A3M7PLR5_BRAPC|nr:hypothetical protein BpHYR1_003292 [Brachionus plicatilis]
MKQEYDERMRVRELKIEVGERVLDKTKQEVRPKMGPTAIYSHSQERHNGYSQSRMAYDSEIPSSKVQVSLAPLEDPPRDQTQTTQTEVQMIQVATQPQITYKQTQTSTPTTIDIPAQRKAGRPTK